MTTATIATSEWTKFRSVRSTPWSLGALVVGGIGLSAILTMWLSSAWGGMSASERAEYTADPVGFLAAALSLSQLAVCVLGVLVITSEYTTGSIRASILAVPDRRLLLLTKAAVLAAVTFVVGEVIGFVSFAIGSGMLSGKIDVGLGDPGVFRAVVGVGMYLSVLSVFAFAIGAIVRHTAGAITAVIGFVLVLSQLAFLIPGRAGEYIAGFLPSNAGVRITQAGHESGAVLSSWQGFGVLALWAAVLLVVATWLIERRDV